MPFARLAVLSLAWAVAGCATDKPRPTFPDALRTAAQAQCLAHALASQPHAARLVAKAAQTQASWAFTLRPQATCHAGIRELAALMRSQRDQSAQALDALMQVLGMARRGEVQLDAKQTARLRALVSFHASVRALAAVRWPALAGVCAAQAKDYAKAGELAKQGADAIGQGLLLVDRVAKAIGGMKHWYAPARGCIEAQLLGERDRLSLLDALSRGYAPQAVDMPLSLQKAALLLASGSVRLDGAVEWTERTMRIPGQRTLLFTRPKRLGASAGVSFDPVDVKPFVAQCGYLRFYVNSVGPRGRQRAEVWASFQTRHGDTTPGPCVYLHRPTAAERGQCNRPGFVDVDTLDETWQLVSIPLSDLVPEGATHIVGLHLRFTAAPDYGLAIADPYLIGDVEPVIHEHLLDE